MSYDDLIKFRSTGELVKRLERIAQHPRHRRDLPDLLRLILEDYADKEEIALGLQEPEISSKRKAELDAKVDEFLLGAVEEVKNRKSKPKKPKNPKH